MQLGVNNHHVSGRGHCWKRFNRAASNAAAV